MNIKMTVNSIPEIPQDASNRGRRTPGGKLSTLSKIIATIIHCYSWIPKSGSKNYLKQGNPRQVVFNYLNLRVVSDF